MSTDTDFIGRLEVTDRLVGHRPAALRSISISAEVSECQAAREEAGLAVGEATPEWQLPPVAPHGHLPAAPSPLCRMLGAGGRGPEERTGRRERPRQPIASPPAPSFGGLPAVGKSADPSVACGCEGLAAKEKRGGSCWGLRLSWSQLRAPGRLPSGPR